MGQGGKVPRASNGPNGNRPPRQSPSGELVLIREATRAGALYRPDGLSGNQVPGSSRSASLAFSADRHASERRTGVVRVLSARSGVSRTIPKRRKASRETPANLAPNAAGLALLRLYVGSALAGLVAPHARCPLAACLHAHRPHQITMIVTLRRQARFPRRRSLPNMPQNKRGWKNGAPYIGPKGEGTDVISHQIARMGKSV